MVIPNDFFSFKNFHSKFRPFSAHGGDLFIHWVHVWQKSYYTKLDLVYSSSNEVNRQKADRLLTAAEKVLEKF